MMKKRMISPSIIDSDSFLDMPLSTQALYFHFILRGDDDGFIGNYRRIMKMVGSVEDEIKVLIAKRFVIQFESGICVIKHWRIHNYIRKDRYQPTTYVDEKSQLFIKANNAYTLEKNNTSTIGMSDVIPMVGEVQSSTEQNSTVQSSNNEQTTISRSNTLFNPLVTPPNVNEVILEANKIGYQITARTAADFINKYSAIGWIINKSQVRDWTKLLPIWKSNERKKTDISLRISEDDPNF